MRNLFFIGALTIHFTYGAIGQCIISGSLKNYEGDKFVVLRQPIDGYFSNISYQPSDTIPIEKDHFYTTILCSRAVFVFLSFSNQCVKLIATPGDSISFVLDFATLKNEKKVECNFSGANAKGHQFFYDYDYIPINKYENIWLYLKTSDEKEIVSDIRNEIKKQLAPVEALYNEGAIDSGYYGLMNSTIQTLLLHEATRRLGDLNLTNVNIKKAEGRITAVKQLFNIYPPINKYVYYGLNSNLYANTYFAFQRSIRLKTKGLFLQPDTILVYKGRKYTITGDFAFLVSIKDKQLKEYLFGTLVLGCLSVGAQEALKDEINFFTSYYPNSRYTAVINSYKGLLEIERRTAIAGYSKHLNNVVPQIIDTSGRIRDFEFSGYDSLKNTLLFVDVWATWCGPCLREMLHNFQIDSFLYAKDIKRLYISIDNPSQKPTWKKMIKDMHLGGYHILAGEAFNHYLSDRIGLREGLIAIPRYLIIRNGKILVNEAARPSDFEELKKQFEEILINQKN